MITHVLLLTSIPELPSPLLSVSPFLRVPNVFLFHFVLI
jgi:hypothetical protein